MVACIGKFGGTVIASRLVGLRWRDSAALGILMNTRGLVELIVLNIGLDLGVISPKLFTMLVLMALVTTFMTTPILHLLLRNHPWIELRRRGYSGPGRRRRRTRRTLRLYATVLHRVDRVYPGPLDLMATCPNAWAR
jgi:hypothetical protein